MLQARREFKQIRSDYDRDRRHVQQLRTSQRVPERMEFSLLWQYYVKGKKTFAALMKGENE